MKTVTHDGTEYVPFRSGVDEMALLEETTLEIYDRRSVESDPHVAVANDYIAPRNGEDNPLTEDNDISSRTLLSPRKVRSNHVDEQTDREFGWNYVDTTIDPEPYVVGEVPR